MFKQRLAIFLLGALSLTARADDAPPLRVGWVFALANAPALIAERKGFYAAEGLRVELKQFNDGPVLQQAVAAGELDVTYVGAPPIYQWASRGLDARIIAKVNTGQAALVAGTDSGITKLADLRGKRVASAAKGSGMDVLLRGYVIKDQAHLDPERETSIVTIPNANMNAALERQVVDAAFTFEPFVSQALLRGKARVVLDVNQALPAYPWFVVMALPKTLTQRPDDVVKLLRAHQKAIAFLNEHPDEANKLIADAFKLEPLIGANGKSIAPEALVQEARKRLGWSSKLTPSDLQFFQRLVDYSSALGFMGKPLKVEQLVDTSFERRAAGAK
ncbi:MAG: ABC transporter substrate-binding protein [Massilia sp.]